MGVIHQQPPAETTIVAPATPAGTSAIAVLRMSGPAAFVILEKLTDRQAGNWRHKQARLATLRDERGNAIDQALILPFIGPASYTGQDLVELHTHGNPVIVARLIETMIGYGAKLADPGAFTRRALLNGKMELPQAEALSDLIEAVSPLGVSQALERLGGGLRTWATALRDELVAVLAQLEAHVDFPDEHIQPQTLATLALRLKNLADSCRKQAALAEQARIWVRGARLAIVGAPNAGKSTLLNRLLGAERAIVSPWAGTTRDYLEVGATLGGVPMQLIDTAGIRPSSDPIEAAGIARSLEQAKNADLVLVLVADDAPFNPPSTWDIPAQRCLYVWNKIDRGHAPSNQLAISAERGDNIEALLQVIATRLAAPAETPLVANLRQIQACSAAALHFAAAAEQLQGGFPPEIAAEEVRAAAQALDRLLGVVEAEQVLDQIFATFCIGK